MSKCLECDGEGYLCEVCGESAPNQCRRCEADLCDDHMHSDGVDCITDARR